MFFNDSLVPYPSARRKKAELSFVCVPKRGKSGHWKWKKNLFREGNIKEKAFD
jgi:hypothetical protein